jgi:rhodanese-related sulfurtransferase
MKAWEAAGLAVSSAGMVDAAAARRWLADGATALDVRESDEYTAGHLPEATHIPLGDLAGRAHEVPADRPIVVYCGHGERASTAVSLLERAGRRALLNLDGGIDAWRDADLPVAR